MSNQSIELNNIIGTPGWAYASEIAGRVLASIEGDLITYDGADPNEIVARHARANGARAFWTRFQAELLVASDLDTAVPDSFGTPRY